MLRARAHEKPAAAASTFWTNWLPWTRVDALAFCLPPQPQSESWFGRRFPEEALDEVSLPSP